MPPDSPAKITAPTVKPPAEISREVLADAVAQGLLMKVERKDLLPSAESDPVLSKAAADVPIYVMVGKGPVPLATTELMDKRPLIIITEGHHRWTEAHLEKMQALKNDEQITKPALDTDTFSLVLSFHSKFESYGEERAAMVSRFATLVESTRSITAAKNVNATLLIESDPEENFNAASITSKEGRHYIVLNEADMLKALRSDTALQNFTNLIAHETTHIAEGHTTPQGKLRIHNRGETHASELAADLGATGPLGTRDTAGYAQYLAGFIVSDAIPYYNERNASHPIPLENPNIAQLQTASDFGSKADMLHPPLMTRIAAQHIQGALMAARDSNAARHGRTEDAKEQADWILDKIMRQVNNRDGETLPLPASPLILPDTVKDKVQGMQGLPMKAMDSATAPLAPASQEAVRER